MSIAVSALFGVVAATIVISVFRSAAGGKSSIRRRRASENAAVAASSSELRKWYREYQIMALVGTAVLAVAWWAALTAGVPVFRNLPDATFKFVVPARFWVIPAMLLGGVTASVIVDIMVRRRLGPRYEIFVLYRSERAGVDTRKVTKVVYLTVALLGVMSTVLLADDYAYFSSERIVIDPFLSVGARRYAYSDVAWIGTAPKYRGRHGHVRWLREYALRFSDGSSWSTLYEPSGAPSEVLEPWARFVSSRSGRPISEVPVLEGKDL